MPMDTLVQGKRSRQCVAILRPPVLGIKCAPGAKSGKPGSAWWRCKSTTGIPQTPLVGQVQREVQHSFCQQEQIHPLENGSLQEHSLE
ncbi:hypothetical protein AV530_017671 [Patagioenas fasciata monilis]|uniref:Uncharacterized protein n=1 Tax=Patagioenas fasciata monilis TaxID=372326 RepID=A0A1V4JU85_PATFA|nr:hypothetical protein AV530_017671 [Patagioenas fasciata monilis]